MRGTYRQFDAGPIVNLARHPRGTQLGSSTGQWPKWQVDRWGGDGTYSLLTGITGHPDGITTAVRLTVTTATRNSHGFHLAGNPEQATPNVALTNQMIPVQPGERVTVSCWLRYTGTVAQAYRLRFRPVNADSSAWVDNGTEQSPYTTLPSGVWTRLSATYTVPSGASFVAVYVTNNNGIVDAIGDTIDGTGLMVTRTPALRGNIATDPFARNIGIPAGAFGWNPRWYGSGGATGITTKITGASDGPAGATSYLRKIWTAMGTNAQDVGFEHANQTAIPANLPSVRPGEVYSFASYFRPSKGWTTTQQCRLNVDYYDATNTKIASVNGANLVNVVGGDWNLLQYSNVVVPANAVKMFVFQTIYVQAAGWTVGDTIDGTGLTVLRDPPGPQFRDGNSPGWKWLGAVNASESVGYPKP